MSDTLDQRAVMGSAIMNAIIDANRAEDGSALIEPAGARQALVVALAMLMEADPAIRTPKEMREAAEGIARDLRLQLRVLRDHHVTTGERAWDATPIRLS